LSGGRFGVEMNIGLVHGRKAREWRPNSDCPEGVGGIDLVRGLWALALFPLREDYRNDDQ